MKYGIKCYSTMCGLTFYIIEETEALLNWAFDMFLGYIHDNNTEDWENYNSAFNSIYCDEDCNYSFMVGKLDNGNYSLVTDRGCKRNEDNKAIEFKLVKTFTERF